MLDFKHVLFPVDLSAQSREAAPFVKAMAVRFGARITVMHVMEIPPYWYGTMGAESFAAMVNLETVTEQRKEQFNAFLCEQFRGMGVEKWLEQGDPAMQIKQAAETRKVDLIMMPTHGYGPFRRLLLGSVTTKVLHDVSCPVWTGVHAERQATHPDQIQSIICAVDLEEHSIPLINWAANFASIYGAKLRLVHGVPGAEAGPEQFFDTELDAFLMNMAREQLAKMQTAAGTSFETFIARGDVAHVVREACLQHDADLVVLGRGLIKKVLGQFRTRTYSIIREAPCPVLSVP
jgi:nucleotide-binding universal stress UspA family protein